MASLYRKTTSQQTKEIVDRLTETCLVLPETSVQTVEGEQHLIFRVRKRTFAYFLFDHHGDGEIAELVDLSYRLVAPRTLVRKLPPRC